MSMSDGENVRFVIDGYNIILDTECEMYYEAFDNKSAEKLLRLLNSLEQSRLFYKEKSENFKKLFHSME